MSQRTEKGGVWIRRRWICFLGRPDFRSGGSRTLIFKGFRENWGKNLGRPTNADPTTTDQTPDSRPSESQLL